MVAYFCVLQPHQNFPLFLEDRLFKFGLENTGAGRSKDDVMKMPIQESSPPSVGCPKNVIHITVLSYVKAQLPREGADLIDILRNDSSHGRMKLVLVRSNWFRNSTRLQHLRGCKARRFSPLNVCDACDP